MYRQKDKSWRISQVKHNIQLSIVTIFSSSVPAKTFGVIQCRNRSRDNWVHNLPYLLLSFSSRGLCSLFGRLGCLSKSCSLPLYNCVDNHDALFSTSMKNLRINSSCCFLMVSICLYFFLASNPLVTKKTKTDSKLSSHWVKAKAIAILKR